LYAFPHCATYAANLITSDMIHVAEFKLVRSSFYIRDSVVGIATRYGMDDQEVGVPVGSRIFSSQRRPDRLWSPPNLLSNGYRALFPRG
jgi:hypothetical protein